MKNVNNKSVRQSFKGKREGQVGAPPKFTKWPKSQFDMATLFNINSPEKATRGNGQCQLSLRTKVATMLLDGTLIRLADRKQPKGAVGRPKSVYILKENFVADKHTVFGTPVPVKAVKTKTTKKATKKTTKRAVRKPAPAVEVNAVETNPPATAPETVPTPVVPENLVPLEQTTAVETAPVAVAA